METSRRFVEFLPRTRKSKLFHNIKTTHAKTTTNTTSDFLIIKYKVQILLTKISLDNVITE